MGGKRRRWTAEKKLEILREGRETDASIAGTCRRHGISPGQFYGWEKRAREGALDGLRRRGRKKDGQREEVLKQEICEMRAMVAELMKENLKLKKGNWP